LIVMVFVTKLLLSSVPELAKLGRNFIVKTLMIRVLKPMSLLLSGSSLSQHSSV
jgi:hypothetical protein